MRTMEPAIARLALLISFFLMTVSVCAAQAPTVEKVEPPNWWAGHSINPVRVLIRGKNLSGARVEATGREIRTGLVRVNEAGTYLFVDIYIDADAKPGARRLRIVNGSATADAPFEIPAP